MKVSLTENVFRFSKSPWEHTHFAETNNCQAGGCFVSLQLTLGLERFPFVVIRSLEHKVAQWNLALHGGRQLCQAEPGSSPINQGAAQGSRAVSSHSSDDGDQKKGQVALPFASSALLAALKTQTHFLSSQQSCIHSKDTYWTGTRYPQGLGD